ncbi:anti-anti-sigma factor [Mycobacterium sp. GA-1841]|nr:anti-anti-sigma factor [Mycobacterium sp. GA-1841]
MPANVLTNHSEDSPAAFANRRLPPGTAVISARGEIDAANATEFADYAVRNSAEAERLVIDLANIEFFGTAGFSALRTIADHCSAGAVDWVLVPSKSVNRLLRICDPDSGMRSCYNVAAALSALNGKTPLLQLVTKSR